MAVYLITKENDYHPRLQRGYERRIKTYKRYSTFRVTNQKAVFFAYFLSSVKAKTTVPQCHDDCRLHFIY